MPEPARDADELLVRWELGLADADDEAALAALLRDPGHRRAFARQARIAAALAEPRPAAAAEPPSRRPRLRPRPPRTAARPPVWALAAGLAAAIALAIAWPRLHPARIPPAARLLTAGADACAAAADGAQRPVHAGDDLAPGETLLAGGGPATLALAQEAARIAVAAGTRLTMPAAAAAPGPLLLVLASGRVEAEVAPRPPGSPLAIAGPQARAEVVGTRFALAADERGMRLTVAAGSVRLRAADGQEVLAGPGQAAFAGDGQVGPAPLAAGADEPLPAGSRVLWRADPAEAAGWNGAVDRLDDGPAWRSAPPRPGGAWAFTELRSPIAREGWRIEPGTWLRFRCWTSGFAGGQALEVHVKPADESNFAARIDPAPGSGWRTVRLRLDRDFHHLLRNREAPAIGERIHGIVWSGQRTGDRQPADGRFWIRDAVVYCVAE